LAGGGKVAALIVVGLLAAGVLYQVMNREQPGAAARPSSSGPPANAEYVSDSPLAVLAAGSAGKTAAARSAAADEFIGRWVPEPGWEGPIEEITKESQGVALRLLIHEPKIVGGEYWIIAIVGDDHGCKKGDTVHVQGKIKDISSKLVPGTPSIVSRIVLEEARVIGPTTR
jgi:hypothetical protein